jgi:hypothetical protein
VGNLGEAESFFTMPGFPLPTGPVEQAIRPLAIALGDRPLLIRRLLSHLGIDHRDAGDGPGCGGRLA